jgi:hypothetical protein
VRPRKVLHRNPWFLIATFGSKPSGIIKWQVSLLLPLGVTTACVFSSVNKKTGKPEASVVIKQPNSFMTVAPWPCCADAADVPDIQIAAMAVPKRIAFMAFLLLSELTAEEHEGFGHTLLNIQNPRI